MWSITQNNIALYTISSNYLNYLRKIDYRIPQEHTGTLQRPFIGILITDNKHNYFIPLSSPKPKHAKMKNSVDFQKIGAHGEYGAINFNNMFPVPANPGVYSQISTVLISGLSAEDIQYRQLLINQLTWLNIQSNFNVILKKAKFLHNSYLKGTLKKKVCDRCCDFALLEKEYKNYSPGTTY